MDLTNQLTMQVSEGYTLMWSSTQNRADLFFEVWKLPTHVLIRGEVEHELGTSTRF